MEKFSAKRLRAEEGTNYNYYSYMYYMCTCTYIGTRQNEEVCGEGYLERGNVHVHVSSL